MISEIQCKASSVKLDKTVIMGVLNITPDSFSDGNLFLSPKKAIDHAKQMIAEGADIIDIGGESTRPGAAEVSAEEELSRVLPVIEQLRKETNVPISIDTYKPEVAKKCLEAGADIINDISGLQNNETIAVAKKHNAPVIIMHMQGTPRNMQKNPKYDDVVVEIKEFFKKQKEKAEQHGISQIILDPGIGFGKTVEHNLEILKRLNEFQELDCPLLIGTSRKSFIGKITGATESERLPGTIASITAAILNGVHIVRVHDVKECKQAVEIVDTIRRNHG